ncbi:hypothetical protein [uncultured Muribaculum sp.]|uniref:hypothetical protein n=1 Tax=uncultured Muribaculum sp. TaxID=1918613 RepID=UPI002657AEBC|nr:hypothetical protein [uncultured Muribaculum sp.]
MSKLRLLTMVVLMLAFLLSLWGVPVVMAVIAVTVIETLWIKIALWVAAAMWLLLLRPWTMFRNPRFGQFISDMRRAFIALIN